MCTLKVSCTWAENLMCQILRRALAQDQKMDLWMAMFL